MKNFKIAAVLSAFLFLSLLSSKDIKADYCAGGLFACQLDICCPSGLCPPFCTAYDNYEIQCSHFNEAASCNNDKDGECVAHSNPYNSEWYCEVDNCYWQSGGATPPPGGGCDDWGWHTGDCGGCAYVDPCCPANKRNKWRWNTCTGWYGTCVDDPTCECTAPTPPSNLQSTVSNCPDPRTVTNTWSTKAGDSYTLAWWPPGAGGYTYYNNVTSPRTTAVPAPVSTPASYSWALNASNACGTSGWTYSGFQVDICSTCTVTSNFTCNADGTEITTTWNVTSKNFTINTIQGRFNKSPMGDWPQGPGDLSLNWGSSTTGTRTTTVAPNTDYSVSVGVYKDPIDPTWNNYICRSTSQILNCTPSLACDAVCDPAEDDQCGDPLDPLDNECILVPVGGGVVVPLCRNPLCELDSDCNCGFGCSIGSITGPSVIVAGGSDQYLVVPVPSPAGEGIDNVRFDVSDCPSHFSITPGNLCTITDSTGNDGYTVNLQANGNLGDSSVLTATATTEHGATCPAAKTITITSIPAWWQVIDADIFSQGIISSILPGGETFDMDGIGGFPGVPVYDGSYNFGSGEISSENWIADADYSGSLDKYSYFWDKVQSSGFTPSEFTNSSVDGDTFFDSGGTNWPVGSNYYWYKATNADGLTITGSNLNFPSPRKIILFVDNGDVGGEDLVISDTNVNFTEGTSLFMVIASGNIRLVPVVSLVEGIYVADGTFSTGADDLPLNILGSVVGWGGSEGVSLERDLTDNSIPAEIFTFSPAQIFQIPSIFGRRNIIWKEVVP